MNTNIELEIKKALQYIRPEWKMQNNYNDYKSNFIYRVKTVDECIREAENNNIELQYVLHRWYNFVTSIHCEELFIECGAEKEEDLKNKEIDIYIDGVPFDVKLTVYPKALYNHPYNLKTREGKNKMIEWMYEHQSQQGRKHLKNRLFIVCDGKEQYNSLCLKSDFEQIKTKIQNFMQNIKINGFNEMIIIDGGIKYKVISDIICIN